MIAVDTNVLVYAHRAEMPPHRAAYEALRRLAEGDEAWALPIFCVGEFIRVVTHPRVFQPPSSLDEARVFVEHLLGSPSLRLLLPGERYWPLLAQVLAESGATGNDVFDAIIVALCLEHGATTLLTRDRGFNRFRRIKVERIERSR